MLPSKQNIVNVQVRCVTVETGEMCLPKPQVNPFFTVLLIYIVRLLYNNSFSEGVNATDVKWNTTNSACTSTERTACDAKGNSTQFAYWDSECYDAANCKLAGLTWKAGKAAEGGVAAVPSVCASALWVRSSYLFTLIIIGRKEQMYLLTDKFKVLNVSPSFVVWFMIQSLTTVPAPAWRVVIGTGLTATLKKKRNHPKQPPGAMDSFQWPSSVPLPYLEW